MDELEPGEEPPASRLRVSFTSDGRFLVSSTYPPKAETDKAKRDRKKPEDMPKQGLVIIETATGKASRVERVKSFQVPEKGGPWVAFLEEATPEPGKAQDPREGGGASSDAPARKEYGTELVLRDLARGERVGSRRSPTSSATPWPRTRTRWPGRCRRRRKRRTACTR